MLTVKNQKRSQRRRNLLTIRVKAALVIALGSRCLTLWAQNYQYDNAGRLLNASYSDSQAVIYTYDKASNLATVGTATVPVISVLPQNPAVTVGGSVTLTVSVNGMGSFSYQWLKNGAAIPGATNSTLILSNVQFSDAGSYAVVVTIFNLAVTSSPVTLTVNASPAKTGGGGGGGALSLWFYTALAVLLGLRRNYQRKLSRAWKNSGVYSQP